MDVVLIQANLVWNAPQVNREYFEQKIAEAGRADLIILPEMFSTGFCTRPRGVAEPAGGTTLQWMQKVAGEKAVALCGSVATEADGCYYNRFYFVFPDGSYRYYDKRHLFTFGGEHKEYTAGQNRVVVEYKGWRILLQVCYDLRFPVWSRNRGGLRPDYLCGELAYAPGRCMERFAPAPGYREFMLCGRSEPGG